MVTNTSALAMTTCTQSTLALACLTRIALNDDLTLDEKAVWIDQLPTPLRLTESDRKIAESVIRRVPSAALRTRLQLVVRTR